MHWAGNSVLSNLLPISWSQLLSAKPVDEIKTKPCKADASHSPREELRPLCALQICWKWEGHILFKGGRDITRPLAFVGLGKVIPFKSVYITG